MISFDLLYNNHCRYFVRVIAKNTKENQIEIELSMVDLLV